jgi:hypothetical protein
MFGVGRSGLQLEGFAPKPKGQELSPGATRNR